jgi:DNA repair exonuclease SbcCD ATPase subunit
LSEKAQEDAADLRRQLQEARHQPSSESEVEGQQLLELQQQLSSVQEESRRTAEQMQTQIVQLQRQVEVAQQQPAGDDSSDGVLNDRLQQLRTELEDTVASKDAEIEVLQASLEQAKQAPPAHLTTESSSHVSSAPHAASSDQVQQELEAARHEAEEINRRSQEDIYKKESRIRELEDRLNSGLGEYAMEDILARDEEIEELRSANEAAQEWMAKAVEHHQVLTNQVRTLTEEKSALSSQLNELQGQPNSNASEASLKLFESQLEQTTSELQDLRSQLASREQELTSLKTASSGLEQELEIARDDLGNLKRQHNQSEETVSKLEARLAENALSSENESLRASNEDLNSRLEEFQAWADLAQTKISEILAAKESAEKLLEKANEQLNTKDQEMKRLEDKLLESIQSSSETEPAVDQVTAKQQALESANETLSLELTEVRPSAVVQNDTEPSDRSEEEVAAGKTSCEDCETLKKQYTVLESSYKELQTWTEGAQKEISELLEAQKDLEGSLSAAKQEALTSRDESERIKQQLRSENGDTEGVQAHQSGADVVQTYAAADVFGSGETTTASATAESLFGPGEDAPDSNPTEEFFGAAPSSREGGNLVDFLQQQLRQKEEDLRSLQQRLSDDDDVVEKWEGRSGQLFVFATCTLEVDTCCFYTDRVAELEQEVKSLHDQIGEQEEEANTAITRWQESFADSEKKYSELEAELEAVRKQTELLQGSKGSLENDEEGFQSSKKELDEKIASLEDAIDEEMDELHQSATMAVGVDHERVEDLKRELKQVQEVLGRDEDIVAQWEGKIHGNLVIGTIILQLTRLSVTPLMFRPSCRARRDCSISTAATSRAGRCSKRCYISMARELQRGGQEVRRD